MGIAHGTPSSLSCTVSRRALGPLTNHVQAKSSSPPYSRKFMEHYCGKVLTVNKPYLAYFLVRSTVQCHECLSDRSGITIALKGAARM
jgi:hypothetical protein